MIKLGGSTKSGRKFVVLGLSELNLISLRAKKPIHVGGDEIGLPELESLIICWGRTEDDLAYDFRDLIDLQTRVRDLREDKKQ